MNNRDAARLGKRGGLSKSPAKAQAARANGAKGGRPKTNLPLEAGGKDEAQVVRHPASGGIHSA